MNPRRVAFYTLGCKLNFAESSTIERLFGEKGYVKVDFKSSADVIVINTCTVTASADKKCRNIIRKAVRTSPGSYLVVLGCYSQLKACEIEKIPGVDLVLGSDDKYKIFEYSGNFTKSNKPLICSSEIDNSDNFTPAYSISGRTRSFLKIQDGCDYFCSYCTIPMARGPSRSASEGDILMQLKKIADSGVKEVVLTGVNIGDFGKKGSRGLLGLLQQIENHSDIERFRISSIEPDLLSDDIIELIANNPKFAPHFHLPLQSGCDRILEKMNRKYCRSHFTGRVEKIRKEIPMAGIGADVITGFPGESEQDFEETLEFLENSDIAFLHVFSYSARSNTRAFNLPDRVSPEIKYLRSKILHHLADKKLRSFKQRCIGQVHKVLFEASNRRGTMSGFTGNYIKVAVPADENFINRIVDVELTGLDENGLVNASFVSAGLV